MFDSKRKPVTGVGSVWSRRGLGEGRFDDSRSVGEKDAGADTEGALVSVGASTGSELTSLSAPGDRYSAAPARTHTAPTATLRTSTPSMCQA